MPCGTGYAVLADGCPYLTNGRVSRRVTGAIVPPKKSQDGQLDLFFLDETGFSPFLPQGDCI